MSTIRDVAERAGVSTMTVSRVINNSGYISQDARERVEAAIAEIGYVPNTLARSLRFKQTKTLALVLTDITNPFFTTLARGAEDVASEQGFNVIFCNTDESESEQAKELTALVQKRVDGVLLVPAASSAEAVAFLREQGVPVVVLDRRVPDCTVDSVRCDSEKGAYELVKLLLDLGHTRIAALSGPQKVSTAQDRVAGYRRALADRGSGPMPRSSSTARSRRPVAMRWRRRRWRSNRGRPPSWPPTTSSPSACTRPCARPGSACRKTCRSWASMICRRGW